MSARRAMVGLGLIAACCSRAAPRPPVDDPDDDPRDGDGTVVAAPIDAPPIDAGPADAGPIAALPDAAAVPDATAPRPTWDWAGVRADGGRWRRSPDCDYARVCPVWQLAAVVTKLDHVGKETWVTLDLGTDDHVAKGMVGRMIGADGRPDRALFTVTKLAARWTVATAPGKLALISDHMIFWDRNVSDMPPVD